MTETLVSNVTLLWQLRKFFYEIDSKLNMYFT